MISVDVQQLPLCFRDSTYGKTFELSLPGTNDADNFVLVPESCTRTDESITNMTELAHTLRTVLFWGFSATPTAVWDAYVEIITNPTLAYGIGVGDRGDTLAEQCPALVFLCDHVPDLEKALVYKELGAILELYAVHGCTQRVPTYNGCNGWFNMYSFVYSSGSADESLVISAEEQYNNITERIMYSYDWTANMTARLLDRLIALKWVVPTAILMERVIQNGQLDCLRTLHRNHECRKYWCVSTSRHAEKYGQIECLRYLHQHGCPRSPTTHSAALAH